MDVWVEGPERTVKMFNVPACSMYALPVDFKPAAGHFEDPHGEWQIDPGGGYKEATDDLPSEDTGNSPWNEDVLNCP